MDERAIGEAYQTKHLQEGRESELARTERTQDRGIAVSQRQES